jgi:hypothetical protein
MSICRYSFHDISRVELDEKRPCLPRFNMPFELGAAVGMAEHSGYKHFCMRSTRNRIAPKIAQ